MKAPIWITAAAFALVLAAGGCTTPNPAVQLPQITFQHEAPIRLAVDRIEVVDAYKEPLSPPNVEHKMETTPTAALETWAHDRLKAAGDPNRDWARLTITNARMVEQKLPLTQGIKGTFTTDQAYRYTLTVAARLEIFDANNRRIGEAQASASRNQTTPEDATLNDLHMVWFKLLDSGMKDFDKEMDSTVRRYLPTWVR